MFLVKKSEVIHYGLAENVDWSLVPDSPPVHVSGCGDTFAGSYVSSIANGHSIEVSLKRALTAWV